MHSTPPHAHTSRQSRFDRKRFRARKSRPVTEPQTARAVSLGEALRSWMAARGGDARRTQLEQLWKNWTMVMGPDLAPLAVPLGHREGLLVVGAEDHFLMQELTYAVPEILERVNAFMGEDVFRKVELRLVFDRTPLNLARATVLPPPPAPVRPPRLGDLKLDPDSPVGRCYAAYVRCFRP